MTRNPGTPQEAVSDLYTRRARTYVPYVQAFAHRQGLRAVLEASSCLRPGMRILDAGCGTGLSILALLEALRHRGLAPGRIDAFDLTPSMLASCRTSLAGRGVTKIECRQADVLHLDEQLPPSWRDYDLIVSASMLEHVPRPMLPAALASLGRRLATGGRLLAVVTRRSFYPARWIWHCEGYSTGQLAQALGAAGLEDVTFRHYPLRYGWLNIGNLVAEATHRQEVPQSLPR
jgi:cyclopropane fatty-acyl-phospholipid synthase-like methyltransferase